MDFVQKIRSSNSFEEKKQTLEEFVAKENEYRRVFAQDRENPSIADPYVSLIPVHNLDSKYLDYVTPFEDEEKIPKAMPLKEKKKPGNRAIYPKKDFERAFETFTEGSLRYLNWSNVFCAGGAVLAALMPVPDKYSKRNQLRREFYHEIAYPSSDVDLFIYGLSEEEGIKKMTEIYESICDAIPYEVIAFRCKSVITLVSQYPHRHIQIVLRLYKSPAEVLMGFDVDCCSVGYDGSNVWMTPRAYNSIVSQYNTVDMSRRSPSYEVRLAKYAERGFEVQVPNLNRERIDPQIFEKPFDKVQGLARLLQIERLRNPEARYQFKKRMNFRKMRNVYHNDGTLWSKISMDLGITNPDRTTFVAGPQASDYSTVFLPWGKDITADKCRRIMYSKDSVLNSYWIMKKEKRKHHLHPCFMGRLPQVLKNCCNSCPKIPEDFDHESYVVGEVSFIKDNPGRQEIGSFHPINEGEWASECYIETSRESLCIACLNDDHQKVEELLKYGADPSGKDPLGRSPLHLCAINNSINSAKLIILAGGKLTARLSDGRTPLHIACEYGHFDIAKLILDKSESNKLKVANKKIASSDKEQKQQQQQQKQQKQKQNDEEEEDDDDDEDYEDYDEEEEEEEEEVKEKKKGSNDEFATEKVEDDPESDEIKLDIVDLEKTDWDLYTPLHYAILFCHLPCVELLLKHGAKITHNFLTTTKLLYSLLHMTTFCIEEPVGLKIATMLMEAGARVSTMDQKGNTALHYASATGRDKFVKLFLEVDPSAIEIMNDLNRDKQSPMYLAAKFGHDKVIKALIEAGAKVTIDSEDIKKCFECKAFKLYTRNLSAEQVEQPISAAVESNNPISLELLANAGADVNLQTGGKSLLDIIDQSIKDTTERKKKEFSQKKEAELNKKTEKEKKKHKLELEKQQSSKIEEMESKLTYVDYLIGEVNKNGPIIHDESEDSTDKKEKDEKEIKNKQQCRNILVEKGAKNLIWMNKMSYAYIPHTKNPKEPLSDINSYQKLFEACWEGDLEKIESLTIKSNPQLLVSVMNSQGHTPLTISVLRNHPKCVKRIIEIAELQYTDYSDVKSSSSSSSSSKDDDRDVLKINNFEFMKGVDQQKFKSAVKAPSVPEPTINPENMGSEDLTSSPSSSSSSSSKKKVLLSPSSAADLIRHGIHSCKPNELFGIHAELFEPRNNIVTTAFQIAVVRGYLKVIEEIYSAVLNLKNGLGKKKTEEMIYTEEELRYLLLASLYQVPSDYSRREFNQLNLLSICLTLEHLDVARFLISKLGACDSFSFVIPNKNDYENSRDDKDDDDEDDSQDKKDENEEDEDEKQVKEEEENKIFLIGKPIYEGLTIEGKSMSSPAQNRYPTYVFPVHICSFVGSTDSLNLISKEGPQLLKEFITKHCLPCDPRKKLLSKYANNDISIVSKRLFNLNSLDTNGNTTFLYAVDNNNMQIVQLIHDLLNSEKPGSGVTLLNYVHPKKNNCSPFQLACKKMLHKMVELLLKLGADPLIKNKDGWTDVEYSIVYSNEKVVKVIMDNIPDEKIKSLLSNVDDEDQKPTLLMSAMNSKRLKILKILSQSKPHLVNLSDQDRAKDTLLHVAARSGVPEYVKVITSSGWDVSSAINTENASGMTPVDISMKAFRNQLCQNPIKPREKLQLQQQSQTKSSKSSKSIKESQVVSYTQTYIEIRTASKKYPSTLRKGVEMKEILSSFDQYSENVTDRYFYANIPQKLRSKNKKEEDEEEEESEDEEQQNLYGDDDDEYYSSDYEDEDDY